MSSFDPPSSAAASPSPHPPLGWMVRWVANWVSQVDWGPWTSVRPASSGGPGAPGSRTSSGLRLERGTYRGPLQRPSCPLRNSQRGDIRILDCLDFACLRLPWARRRGFRARERFYGRLVRQRSSVPGLASIRGQGCKRGLWSSDEKLAQP